MAAGTTESLSFGTKVRVDGKDRGSVIAASYTNNEVRYNVHIEGTATHVYLPPSRLTVIPAACGSSDAAVRNALQTSHLSNLANTPLNPNPDGPTPPKVKRNADKENVNPFETTPRFKIVNDDDIEEIITKQTNKNTLNKTCYDLNLLKSFLAEPTINETRPIEEIPPPELNKLLCKFFIAVKKPNGQNYEPSSLRGFFSSFDRQLRRRNYGFSLTNDVQFAQLREVLKSKQRELKRDGKGNKPNKTDPISDDDIELFWSSGQFGVSSPDSVINTLCFFNTVHFGLRGAHEHREMCWGDVSLQTDSEGQEYLIFNERQTKTRPGDNPKDVRPVKPKMWSNPENPARCPVEVYKLYASKRPADFCGDDTPFYIATSTVPVTNPLQQWFKRQPIGEGKLTSIVRRMAAATGLSTCDRKLSNHSARKHLIQKLSDTGVPANQIMQISGHRNVQSVNNYSHINQLQHKQISTVLNNPSSVQPVTHYRPISPAAYIPASASHAASVPSQSRSQTTRSEVTNSQTSYHIHGGLHCLFAGSMHGGNVHVHIHNNKDDTVDK